MPVQLTLTTLGQIVLDAILWCASDGSLLIASLALSTRALRRSASGPLGVALSLVLWIAVKATIVQGLGLLGALRPFWLMAASVATAIAMATTCRDGAATRSVWRRIAVVTRSAIAGPRGGVGWLAAAALIVLVLRAGLVEGLDSLSIQGPMIVEWIQQGRVSLLSFWNYPQIWEYQAVPPLLLGPGDTLAVIPRLTGAVLLLLTTTEVGRRLGLGARDSWTAAWFVVLSPLVWGLEQGEGTFKNDVAMAVGLLLAILAIERTARQVGGSGALFTAGAFLMVGTKPTGPLFTLLAAILLAAIRWTQGRRPRWLRAGVLAGALITVPGATQLANFAEHGNPIFPFSVRVGSIEVFEGTLDVQGTSILEHVRDPRTWRLMLRGARTRTGREIPVVVAIGAAGLAVAMAGLDRRRTPRAHRRLTAAVFAGSVAALVVAWMGTPWSRGVSDSDAQFLSSGLSLRYAMAPLVVLTTAGVAATSRVVPWMVSTAVGSIFWLGLAIARWSGKWALWLSSPETIAWLVVCLAAGSLAALSLRQARAHRPAMLGTVAAVLTVLVVAWSLCLGFRRERDWVQDTEAIWRVIWSEPSHSPMTIAISDPRVTRRYVLYGPRLENRLRVVIPRDLSASSSAELRFYVLQERPGNARRLPERLELLSRAGWRRVADSADGLTVLLEYGGPQ